MLASAFRIRFIGSPSTFRNATLSANRENSRMNIIRPQKGQRIVTTTPIRTRGADVTSGTIKLYSTASNQEIPIGTKGIIRDVADQRAWIDLTTDMSGRDQSISIDLRSFGSYFDIFNPMAGSGNQSA